LQTIWLTNTANGFTAAIMYVVTSVVGNAITLSDRRNSGANISATGNGTNTINFAGMPNLEVSTIAGAAVVTGSKFHNLDLEGTGTCMIYAEDVSGASFAFGGLSIGGVCQSSVVMRHCDSGVVACNSPVTTDIDQNSNQNGMVWSGMCGINRQLMPNGLYRDVGYGNGLHKSFALDWSSKGNGGNLTVGTFNGSTFLSWMKGFGLPVKSGNVSTTFGGGNAGVYVFNGASGQTITLGVLSNAVQTSLGIMFLIANVSANTVTLTGNGTQTFNGGASTSVTLPAKSLTVVIGGQDASSTLMWIAAPITLL